MDVDGGKKGKESPEGGKRPEPAPPEPPAGPSGDEGATLFAVSGRTDADAAGTLPGGPPPAPPATAPSPAPTRESAGASEMDDARTLVRERSAMSMIPTRVAKTSRVSLTPGELPPEAQDGPAAAERYSRMGEIGRGGMGAILKVVDNDIRRPVAMKVILGGSDEDKLSRFVEEAQVTGQLEHPNIVPVHELGVTPEGKVYFTMKLVKGESLDAILDKVAAEGRGDPAGRPYTDRYPLSHLLEIFLKICDALAFAHSRGVLHRDLKPENVMAGAFGEVLVLDWGLAKVKGRADKASEAVATARSESEGERSITGDVMGTPAYMPPEQAKGLVEEIDARSDVFALGGILYKILTRKAPYGGATVTNILASAMDASWTPPRRRAPELDVPPELESVCMRAMAARKEDRYPDVESMVADLRAFQDRRLVSAHRYSAFSRLVRFVQRHPAASLAAGITVFLVALGGSATGFMASRASLLADLVESQGRRADAEKEKREAEERRAEAEAAKAATEAKLRNLAEADAANARSNLEKGRLVSAVMRAAELEFDALLLELKRNRNSGMPLEGRRAFLEKNRRRLEAFEKTVKPDSASRAAWKAMEGWVLHLSGFEEDSVKRFAESAALDADVPYGPLFECMAAITEYIEKNKLPRPMYNEARPVVLVQAWSETKAMEEARKRFQEKVLLVRNSQVWGESSATDFEQLLHDFRGIHEKQWSRAEKGLSAALGVAELRWVREEILRARADARFQQWAFESGLEDARKLIELMPGDTGARVLAGMFCIALGRAEDMGGRDALPYLGEAVAHFEKALESDPGLKEARMMIGIARMCVAIFRYHRELGPDEEYETAIRILEDVSGGNDPVTESYIQLNLVLLHIMVARHRSGKGLDDGGHDERAIRACDRLLEANPRDHAGLFMRAETRRRRGDALMSRGLDPTADLEAAAEDYKAAGLLGRTDLLTAIGGCKTHLSMGRYLFAKGQSPTQVFARAAAGAESILKVEKGEPKSTLALAE
ncbi:MAG: serine/threonine protein kinase, partial [Planctomycetes bacterium]|nr:serine/threonine protein kinase [Planctomycetota bacterium]